MKNRKGLLILHLNIRSIVNKIELIRHLLNDEQIDALCLTESWLTDYVTDDLIHIDGYKILRKDREKDHGTRRGGGFVFIYGINTQMNSCLLLATAEIFKYWD